MKSILLSSLLSSALFTPIVEQIKPIDEIQFIKESQTKSKRKIQLVILFDTSSSMDGLLNQAKSRLWEIVNESGSLRYNDEIPTLEIAMYDYGNTSIQNNRFVRKQLDFSSDLDLVSQKLFGLNTSGGDEYCGAVIEDALNQLEWSSNEKDLKMIYIAGNEPFNQGPVNYKEVCSIAQGKDVLVNTIYCGEYMQGVREFWKDGASCAEGDYFNINSDKKIVFIPTPYDDQINEFSNKINSTYVAYNGRGAARKSMQSVQDENAVQMNASVANMRAKAKISSNYSNGDWDLIDAFLADSTVIHKLKKEDLPTALKEKSTKELELFVAEKLKEREQIKHQIAQLSIKRDDFIKEKRAEMNDGQVDDLGTAINNSILNKAIQLGFQKLEE